jgi:hypothetical protein
LGLTRAYLYRHCSSTTRRRIKRNVPCFDSDGFHHE